MKAKRLFKYDANLIRSTWIKESPLTGAEHLTPASKTYQVNIETQLEYSVDVGEVVEHDLSVDAGEEPSQHTRSQEHERRVQTDDSE